MSVRKHIPNAITSLNLLCGVIGIILTLNCKSLELAFFFMLAAVVFDFCDGLAARLLGAYSEIGKELDSLADVVSFGVLPSVMLYKWYSLSVEGPWHNLVWVPLLLAVFSALRLAKFNLDERQHDSFIGLPTPACALICGSFCTLHVASVWIIPLFTLVFCWLLVCEIPMFSLKFGKDIHADAVTRMKRYAIVSIAAIVVVIVFVLGLPWQAIITGVLLAYILENALCAIFKV